jgi:ring-1,2-phenylacetyl-CoA epoxidase subunit PaaD
MIIVKEDIYKILSEVMDPEVPVLSVLDLGIVRDVQTEDDRVIITITPTYSGCPAMDMIRKNIEGSLNEHGYPNVQIRNTLSPAWTTDWMSEAGKDKLRVFGIAPPNPTQQLAGRRHELEAVHARIASPFIRNASVNSAPACKAIWRCLTAWSPQLFQMPLIVFVNCIT